MDKNERIKYLFDQAVDLSPAERTVFIEAECDDESLRATVFLYLNAHDDPASDLVNPMVDAPDVVATLGLNVAEFQLIRQLGIGGMGDVFLAEDTILKRHVAIKTLSPRLLTNEKAIGRFRYEAQAAARLDHPAIVSVFSYGEDAGTHFIAMEYIEGETLAKHLNTLIHPKKRSSNKENPAHLQPTTLSESGRVSYAVQLSVRVADALEYAHQQKVIHRDVKPSNILLDKKGNPHLADFGIAKIIDVEPLTLTNEFTGTYHYASPEQAKANRASIDNRSDVFSLGVVLYEILTLNRPFTGDTSQQILEAVCVHEPLDVRKINDSIPRDLATICHKALEKRPVDRYQSAGHMAADLRSFEKRQPILAQPPGFGRRLRKFSQRHRLLIAMLLVLTTGVSVGRWIATNNNDYARLTVQTDDKSTDTHVSIYPYNSTLDNQRVIDHMGKRVEQGNLSSNHAFEIKLTPGVYWVIVKGIDGGFSERAVFLTAQADEVIKLNPTTPQGPFDEMAYIKTSDENTAFWIDRYEVSNKRFRAFLASLEPTERKNMRPLIWPSPYDLAWDNLPVVGVNWESASRYASWENKRLPTVSEWESAVRGAAGRRFPWGDAKVDPSCRANAGEIGGDPMLFLPGSDLEAAREVYLLAVRPVSDTSKPRSNSCTQTLRMDETAEGVSHLYGNVLEWTCSPLSDSMRIPFAGRLLRRNIKGKAWQSQPNQGTELLGQRIIHNGETQLLGLGFRCVRSSQIKTSHVSK